MNNFKRLRVFAGPNGSGKSTLIKNLSSKFNIGHFLNADVTESVLKNNGFLNLEDFNLKLTQIDFQNFIDNESAFIKKIVDTSELQNIEINRNVLISKNKQKVDSYIAALIVEFLRIKLLEAGESFTFETVMSHPSKVEFILQAKELGYKTYLYFIATEFVEINIERVKSRVLKGGHKVSLKNIKQRYFRSLSLMEEAVRNSDRAFIFDNSAEETLWVAEIEGGKQIDLLIDKVPLWFDEYFLKKIGRSFNS